MSKREELMNSLKKPSILYFSFLTIGTCIGLFFVSPQIGERVSNLNEIAVSKFWAIFAQNASVIVIIYLSAIFTKMIAWFTYASNGFMHGIVLGWVLAYDAQLLRLMIPHGIFEIPCILLTGFVVSKGEKFARENPKKFACYLAIHIVGVCVCAMIEAFVTPMFQK